ncbi:MAG: outer rane lipoproteinsorting protein [Pedosphaera sp.]|nr:outer rane lipoproteinsorting protein [Pedosphaera sp.]
MTRRSAFLQVTWIMLAVFFAQNFPLAAQEKDYPEGPQGDRELVADLRNLRPVDNAEWKGLLTLRGRDRTTTVMPVLGQSVSAGETQWKVIYLTSATKVMGAEKMTVIHTVDGSNQYLYARAPAPGAPLGEPKTLTGAEADIPLAGSDFWLSDLGFEFYHWPQQHRLKGELRRGRSCYVLESINPQAKPGGYSRVKSWIDKETSGPIEAEAYGADGKLLKAFELGKFQKVNGRYELRDMTIRNRRSGTQTKLEFDLGKN